MVTELTSQYLDFITHHRKTFDDMLCIGRALEDAQAEDVSQTFIDYLLVAWRERYDHLINLNKEFIRLSPS